MDGPHAADTRTVFIQYEEERVRRVCERHREGEGALARAGQAGKGDMCVRCMCVYQVGVEHDRAAGRNVHVDGHAALSGMRRFRTG